MTFQNKTHVLVVEDLPEWQDMLMSALKDDYVVRIVPNEKAALASLQNGASFAVVVVDSRLQDADTSNRDGIKLIEKVRQIDETIGIIVLTAYGTIREARATLKDLKVDDYLEKYPEQRKLDPRELCESVHRVAEITQIKRNPFVFALLPFTDEFKLIFEIYKETVEDGLKLPCRRADDINLPRRIMDDVRRDIKTAELVIADLSGRNPNVFYEVGMSHGYGKTTVLITQTKDDVPPDLTSIRYIEYENSHEGVHKLANQLVGVIKEVRRLGKPVRVFPPWESEAPEEQNLCVVLTAEDDQGYRVFRNIIEPAVAKTYPSMTCTNVRGLFSPHQLMDEIWRNIADARVVIADLSDKDPNVFYETGISHTIGKKVILMARSKQKDVPFDLRERSCIEYSDRGLKEQTGAQESLMKVLKELLG